MTQTAVVNYAPEADCVELRDVSRPEIGPDDCLVEVAAVGVCGSDLHQWTADHSWPVNYPVILGHEFGGVLVEVGSSATTWNEGDRVVSETAAVIDPNNPMSRQGLYNLDPTRKGFGYGVDGAMTRLVRVPGRCLHRVPDDLPFEKACLTEPCSVAYNAVAMHGSIRPGDRIIVFGPGPIGLLCGAMAKLQGAIVAVAGLERDAARLQIARQYGCETLVGNVEEWAAAGDGLGVDGVIDAAGVSATLKTAIDVVRPNGWISKVGWGRDPIGFSLDPMVQKNVRLQGCFSHNWPIWERVLRLLSTGMLDVGKIIGGTWPLKDWHEAFETMHSGRIAKAVLLPE
ncbi:MAG: zinc-binding dehydrogenase [Planctomycetes bacterium]|nr:zinc-binding dehydrogenase [Planctomycetota bacterium]